MPCVSDNGATAPISALTNALSLGSNRGHMTDDFEPGIIVSAVREASTWTAYGRGPDLNRTGTGPQENWAELQAVCVRPETGLRPHQTWTTFGPRHALPVPPDDSSAEIIVLCTTRRNQTDGTN